MPVFPAIYVLVAAIIAIIVAVPTTILTNSFAAGIGSLVILALSCGVVWLIFGGAILAKIANRRSNNDTKSGE